MRAFIECVAFAALVTLATLVIFGLYAAKVGHPIF